MTTVIEHIKQYEGWSAKTYYCPAGRLTIGYGFNLEILSMPKSVGMKWLEELVLDCVRYLISIFPEFRTYSSQRQIALIDMMYNLGFGAFSRFKKMIAAIKEGAWGEAADQALNSKWARRVGARAIHDAEMLRNG